MKLIDYDKPIGEAIDNEETKQKQELRLIASENYTSKAVMKALSSVLTNKYSEGYPGKRYYGGNEFVDVVENLAVERAKRIFNVPHANVQPYSGSPANLAVYMATCSPGDVIIGQNLPDGGHLTHGWKASVTGKLFKSVPYHVKADGYINLDEVKELALQNKPKLIWVGATSYVREFPFEEFSKIADEVGAYLVADISHISGLVVAGVHKSPVEYAHIVTTTTHKTLRGPRGGIIMVTENGLKKNPDLARNIDKTVFPGLQGGPHNNTTAAIAVALGEALKPEFKEYGKQVVKNSKRLAQELVNNGLKLVSGGTDNHMVVVDLTSFGKGHGIFAQEILEQAGIIVNKNAIPQDPSSPFYPSGIRIGTPALTTRGMKEEDMKNVANWMVTSLKESSKYKLPEDKAEREKYVKEFKNEVKENITLKEIKKEVAEFCNNFPV